MSGVLHFYEGTIVGSLHFYEGIFGVLYIFMRE